ncbi:hypothetical protein KIPB_005810, partial [Kipferlia bialata]
IVGVPTYPTCALTLLSPVGFIANMCMWLIMWKRYAQYHEAEMGPNKHALFHRYARRGVIAMLTLLLGLGLVGNTILGHCNSAVQSFAITFGVLCPVFGAMQWIPQIMNSYRLKQQGSFSILMLWINVPGCVAIAYYLLFIAKKSWSTSAGFVTAAIEQAVLLGFLTYYKHWYKGEVPDPSTVKVFFAGVQTADIQAASASMIDNHMSIHAGDGCTPAIEGDVDLEAALSDATSVDSSSTESVEEMIVSVGDGPNTQLILNTDGTITHATGTAIGTPNSSPSVERGRPSPISMDPVVPETDDDHDTCQDSCMTRRPASFSKAMSEETLPTTPITPIHHSFVFGL